MSLTNPQGQAARLPLTLYIHLPWCVKKCPYCDFNSHPQKGALPFAQYIDALIEDFDASFANETRPVEAIFIGGGTPSLFSAQHLNRLFEHLQTRFSLPQEITLEVNPGAVERDCLKSYKAIGVSRLSLGVQSFNDQALARLGRIHSSQDTFEVIEALIDAGFQRWNIDIMHGLPDQSLAECLEDLQQAIACNPPHLSWYQLTLEPNTAFYKTPPPLPNEDVLYDMYQQGLSFLQQSGYQHYEVSAFSKHPSQICQHNLNYWQFGDYIGIGAGAHSKQTTDHAIKRTIKHRHPKAFMKERLKVAKQHSVASEDRSFEFMLNALRLWQGFRREQFEQRTLLPWSEIESTVRLAQNKNLLEWEQDWIRASNLGKLYLNDLTAMFLDHAHSSSIPNQPRDLS